MKITIISKTKATYSVKRLIEASIEMDLNVQVEHPHHLCLKKGEIVLIRNTGVDYNDDDLNYLEGVMPLSIINSINTHAVLRDKWRQYEFLSKNKFPLIKSYPLDHHISHDLVLKTRRGNGGRGVWILEEKELKKRIAQIIAGHDQDYFLQEKLEVAQEFKGFYCFGEFYFFEKHGGGNLKDGLELSLLETPQFAIEILRRLKKLLKFELISIDFAQNRQGQIFILEVNSCPGFETVEKALGIDIASKILANLQALG